MNKRTFFIKMISSSLVRRRSRMLVALLAIAVGATILSGLVTIYYDVPRQMGAEFRNYGANMVFLPSSTDAEMTMDVVEQGVGMIDGGDLVGVAPFRYEALQVREQPVEAAGTDLEGAKATSPYWHVVGEWPAAPGELLVGKTISDRMRLSPGDTIEVVYSTEDDQVQEDGVTEAPSLDMTITGIVETGGSEEDYMYMSLEDLEELTGTPGKMDVVELSISADNDRLNSYSDSIAASVPDIAPRLVKRVTESESQVLTKLQALVFLVTAVVLVLTMICVATTMTAVVTERRKEIGLRKALGASDREIIAEFMGEGLMLGGLGGLLGSGLGFGVAQFVSRNVFSSSITFQFWLLPVTVISSVLVTGLACLMPVRSATDVDPALVLKGE
ncbi:MAG: FtsX-like permease family protein [Lachnospiraceae bacterium]|nr:FtsX-like permease family protein [Lachnospiraceae bacterium]